MRILAGIQTETNMGANWNSKEKKYKPIVREATKAKAKEAKAMFEEEGMSIAQIAETMNLSISRIHEYLKNIRDDENNTGR